MRGEHAARFCWRKTNRQGIEVTPEAFRSAAQDWSAVARKYGKPGFCESKNGPKKYKTGMAFDEKDGF